MVSLAISVVAFFFELFANVASPLGPLFHTTLGKRRRSNEPVGIVHEKEGRVIKITNVGRSSSDRRPLAAQLQVISAGNDLLKGKAHG
jgi:hypothetical protein